MRHAQIHEAGRAVRGSEALAHFSKFTVEKALAAILEQVGLLAARGRVLAEEIVAGLSVPPCDNSAMDGYAVRFGDIEGATPEQPVRLPVIGDLPAGAVAAAPLQPGQALRIMTGAPIPVGADTVIKQEDTRVEGDTVFIQHNQLSGINIRRAGEDITKGAVVLAPGTLLGPAHTGVLASLKRAIVPVFQRPRVAVLSTGDELVDIDGELGPGKIVSSNSYTLAGLAADAGAEPIMLGIARDTKEALRERLREALRCDVIITSGGVSVGDYDFVKDVLQELGMDMKFCKVAMSPGQPLAFGIIEGRPAFGLPGNPVAAMISFEQFVRPALRKMAGHARLFRTTVEAVAAERVETQRGKKYFIRCRLTRTEKGLRASTTGEQGSGMLCSLAQATGRMIVPESIATINSGDRVKVQILDPNFDFTQNPDY